MSGSRTIHATTIAVREAGVLIRGEAGAGKSSLARRLLQEASARQIFARLVADDRTRLEAAHGRLVARGVEATRGLVEIRGVGVARVAAEQAVIVRLIVDLTEAEPARYPDAQDRTATLCGILLPRIRARNGADLADLVLADVSGLRDTLMTE